MMKATVKTARMTDAELLALGFTREEIKAGKHLPPVGGGVSNSTQIITDLGSALANSPYSTQAQAAQNAPAGPIMALYDNILLCQRKAQEMAEILAYLLGGSQVQGSLTAPTGGPITSANDSATYNLLVGVYQILK